MKERLLIVFLILSTCLRAENLRLPDVRSCALGENGVMLSSAFNPALIPLSTLKTLELSYSNRYMVKELGTISTSFQYPNETLSTGLFLSTFGYDEYRETMLRLAVGKKLGEHWSLGVGFQYSFVQTAMLEHTPARLSTDIGVLYLPVEKLSVGLLIKDFPSVKLNQQGVDLDCFRAFAIQAGFQYEVLEHTLMAFYVGTDQDYRITGGLGIEYTFMEQFYLRGGVKISPLLPTFGIGYVLKSFRLDAAALYHTVLGVSLAVGLSFHF